MARIILVQGDITRQNTDAIVNAANNSLQGGGGVDGAIHRAAGPELLEECRGIGECPTGEARFTKGYKLPAQFVIHTVGPIWEGGGKNEDKLLQSCYKNVLKLAEIYDCRTLSFPSISTGAYGFPIERAAKIAAETVTHFMERSEKIDKVIFVCFSKKDYEIYLNILTGTPFFCP